MGRRRLFLGWLMVLALWIIRVAPAFAAYQDNGNGTVTDTSNGLTWEVKTDDGSARDKDNTYTWQEALDYCEGLTLGGHADWRLPNMKELCSLLDLSRYNPCINTTYFPNTSSNYWSSTTHALKMNNARIFRFNVAITADELKSTNNYVRAVRGGRPLGEAVDNTNLNWTIGGNANWYPDILWDYGIEAARSGSITHSENSWIQTTVTGPGTLSFYWLVSSEASFDYLRFYIDVAEQTQISGYSLDWEKRSYAIGAGTHTVRWTYTKDGSFSSGKDEGWLDRVVYTLSTCPDCPADGIITNTTYPANQICSCSNGTSITLGSNVTVESGAIVTFTAPKVTVQPGFNAKNGSTVRIKQ